MKAAFLIYSPFQVICAYEAITYYGIESPKIFCFGGNYLERNTKTPLLLNELGLSYEVISVGYHYHQIRRVLSQKNVYDICFCGDFFDPLIRLWASILLKKRGRIIYMDDGASTLTATRLKHPLSIPRFKTKVQYVFPLFISFCKKHSQRFYSIFDVPNGDKNMLNSIREKYKVDISQQKGAYVIGTTYKGFHSPELFFPLLRNVLSSITNENIYYSPHRAIADDINVIEVCKECNAKYILSDYCVEVDYIKKGYNPAMIIGFSSTALFTLKKIYPNSKIISVNYPKEMIMGNEQIYRIVSADLEKEGVEIVDVIV